MNTKKQNTLVGAVAIIGLAFAFKAMAPGEGRAEVPVTAETPFNQEQAPPKPCIATYASFSQIKTGDYESILRRKMGCMGDVVSESKINFEKYTTVQWKGADGFSIVSVIMKNRVVISKSQFGLN